MIDLHELANMPGAGRAAAALKKAGHWDEYEGLPQKDFSVKYEVRTKGSVTVRARHENEASTKAGDVICDIHDCDPFDVEIEEVSEELQCC